MDLGVQEDDVYRHDNPDSFRMYCGSYGHISSLYGQVFDMEDKIEYLEKQNREQKKQIELQKRDINMLLRMKV